MAGVSGPIEASHLLLPTEASWLAEFTSELLGFPNARHDDQADALSQLMNWVIRTRGLSHEGVVGSPIIFSVDDDGVLEISGNDVFCVDDPWSGFS